jgi:hypothetical protein
VCVCGVIRESGYFDRLLDWLVKFNVDAAQRMDDERL